MTSITNMLHLQQELAPTAISRASDSFFISTTSYNSRASFSARFGGWRKPSNTNVELTYAVRMMISSPALTAWDDFAIAINGTRPRHKAFEPAFARAKTTGFEKRSRRMKGECGRVPSCAAHFSAYCSCLLPTGSLRFRENPKQLALLLFGRLCVRCIRVLSGLFRRQV